MNLREDPSRYIPRPTPKLNGNGALEPWAIDPAGSRLGFTLRHLIISQIKGRFRRFGGTLYLDRAQPWLSSVNVWVETASIETDSAERDDHIRSEEFLDVARYPRAEFRSTSIEPRGDHLILRGLLQL